ncbi:MAG: NAD-dependent epimerase/dehydratase family protein [Nitrososphaerota archaeon]|nr:NAD-dependent epimerase/dehydratase family protein [Nitrososphaerota archaeon]
MRILIAGMDGYLGWSLALHLAKRGHEVAGFDNLSRRSLVAEIGSQSMTPILGMENRLEAAKEVHDFDIGFGHGSTLDYGYLRDVLKEFKPEAIVDLAEMPSAPYSMIDREHAVFTQTNNVIGTLNLLFEMKENTRGAHLVKLGTMGEYGTPNVAIPEGFFEVEYRGRKDILTFPRQAGSWYHWSKVHDTGNIAFACKIWGLRSTDIMQGVVYGTRTPEMTDDRLLTRFDFDEAFGTAINRFCAQAAIEYPISPYGTGQMRRGFIALVDSIQCMTIAIEHPPEEEEYRVFNQLDEVYGIGELANKVATVARNKFGLKGEISYVKDPRMEAQEHFYEVDHEQLKNLGFKPTRTLLAELEIILGDCMKYKSRIVEKKEHINPTITWNKGKEQGNLLGHI